MRLSCLENDSGFNANAAGCPMTILINGKETDKHCVTIDTDQNLIVRYVNQGEPGYRQDVDTFVTEVFDDVRIEFGEGGEQIIDHGWPDKN